jgi:hypothetical protein
MFSKRGFAPNCMVILDADNTGYSYFLRVKGAMCAAIQVCRYFNGVVEAMLNLVCGM